MNPRTLLPIPILLTLSLASHLGAGEKQSLNLANAIAIALRKNPSLVAYDYELRATEAQQIRAGLKPNPTLAIEAENIPGSGSRSGADVAETTLVFSQVIELGGKRSRRMEQALASRDLTAWGYEIKRVDVIADTTRQFVEVAAAQERQALSREALAMAEVERTAVIEQVQAARSSTVEQQKADIAVSRARIEVEHAASELLAARKLLAARLGGETLNFDSVLADFYSLRPLGSFESLVARLGNNPDLGRFAWEIQLHETQLRSARSARVPDLTLSAGIRHFADENEVAGVFGASIPLPVSDAGRADFHEALMLRGKADALGKAVRMSLSAELYDNYQALSQAILEFGVIENEILPAAREVLKASDEGYQLGRFSYLELTDARRSLIELRRQNIQTALNYHLRRVEIDRLIGTASLARRPATSK